MSEIPLSTFSFGAICATTFCFQIIANPNIRHYTMNPYRVVYSHEVGRIISGVFFHGSLMHILMNMISFMAVGKSLEKFFGTPWMTATIIWSILLTSCIEILLALGGQLFGNRNLMYQHSLGFSGVLFHLATIECYRSPDSLRSIFGIMQVSSKFYPWALLFLTQILLPQVSFLGHLAGIISGISQSSGHLNAIMPSASFLRLCDDSQRLHWITSRESYVRTASNEAYSMFTNPSSGRSVLDDVWRVVCKCICDVIETIKVIVFGNVESNQNIQFNEESEQFIHSEAEMV